MRGRVQGVGFRPYVYRLAAGLRLAGVVGNDTHGAFIEIEGPAAAVAEFVDRLPRELPPLAAISRIEAVDLPVRGEATFRIDHSARDGVQDAEITPDVALCADCRRELFDPADRRYRYPFINCTHCGPRYSIIRQIPYDRPNTTMAVFRMCPACQAEYDDPANRRFHAQPNACPACGPQVRLTDAAGRPLEGDPIRLCARRLAEGGIVAIKGLGGFHLACRADLDEAVATLRERKGRESKPLAVMVGTLEQARALAEIPPSAAEVLADVTRPIVLVPARRSEAVSPHVAPGCGLLGLMLPYTPLHELLFAEGLGPLVMTSGNPTEEPLCRDNDEALQRLGGIADAFLLHNRDIERRVDDSVVLASADEPVVPVRRARGFAPAPIRSAVEAAEPVLAVGAELKSTVCVLAGNTAVVSEHLGELANPRAYRNFVDTVEQFQRLLRVRPAVIACDMHPDYAATRFARRYAREGGLRLVEVQHHHAHLVSVMAEHGLSGGTLGIICDGTGFGTDGTIWGGEILAGDEAGFRRVGHLSTFSLPGGDAAARETWRPAAGLLQAVFGDSWPGAALEALERVPADALRLVRRRLQAGARLPITSSLGRVFDAAAFLLGVCDHNRHEAEAAMALEALARDHGPAEPFPCGRPAYDEAGPAVVDLGPMVRSLLAGMADKTPIPRLARAFHETMAVLLAEAARPIAERLGLRRVCLSGGCFVNGVLLAGLTRRLREAGLEVCRHRVVPTGDGGVSLGQAVCAAAVCART